MSCILVCHEVISCCLIIQVRRQSIELWRLPLLRSIVFVYMLLKDLRIPVSSPPTLWCDNIGTLALASNPVYHACTKHIEADYHFIREKVVNLDILVKFLSTHD